MTLTSVSGYIKYTSKKTKILDQERGGERYTITAHEDGTYVMRTQSLISEDSPTVMRDTILTYDTQWRPREAFVKIVVDNRQYGASLFIFEDDEVINEGHNFEQGRFSIRNDTPEPVKAFICHPMQGDAILCKQYDFEKGGLQEVHPFFSTSFHHRGADGPILKTRKLGLLLRYMGKEQIAVEAGTFDTLHFRIGPGTDDNDMGTAKHPPYDIWVTDDEYYILVKAQVTGYMQTYYELTEFSKRSGF